MAEKKLTEYELALVMHPDLDAKGRDEQIALIEKLLKQLDGRVTKREEGGKKILAYPIEKMTEGWYYFLTLECPPLAVSSLETKLKIEEKLLRYLVIKK